MPMLSAMALLVVIMLFTYFYLGIYIWSVKQELKALKEKKEQRLINIQNAQFRCLVHMYEADTIKAKLFNLRFAKISEEAKEQRDKNIAKFISNEKRKDTVKRKYGVEYAFRTRKQKV